MKPTLPRILAGVVLAAAGFFAAFFIGRATAGSDSAGETTHVVSTAPSKAVIVLPLQSPTIARLSRRSLPGLVEPPPTPTTAAPPPIAPTPTPIPTPEPTPPVSPPPQAPPEPPDDGITVIID